MLYLICFYAPVECVHAIKTAMFRAGAGKLGAYDCCAWQTLGEGQYMPLSGSHAYQGQMNQLEKCAEYKVEIVCEKHNIHDVMQALMTAHPYETPAYQIIEFFEVADFVKE